MDMHSKDESMPTLEITLNFVHSELSDLHLRSEVAVLE